MNKSLTIEELRALEVGDWVWVEFRIEGVKEGKRYVQIPNDSDAIMDVNFVPLKYSDYGITWLAYKNKEQAEVKGEIVELPCLRDKPAIYYHGEPILRKELNYMTKDGTICSETFSEDEFEEAERRLYSLQK